MPIFEYKCEECGHVMEVLQQSRKAAKQICEKCGSTKTKKMLSGFAVGQGKSASPACDSCPTGPACGAAAGCPGGMCPMG